MVVWFAYLFWPAIYFAAWSLVAVLAWRTGDGMKRGLAIILAAAWVCENLWTIALYDVAPALIAMTDLMLAGIVTRVGGKTARLVLALYGARFAVQLADFWLPFPHHGFAFYACLNLAYAAQLGCLGAASAHDLQRMGSADRSGHRRGWLRLGHGLAVSARPDTETTPAIRLTNSCES